MKLTKDQLTRKGLRTREISIPGTDGTITIRELSANEARDYAAKAKAAGTDPDNNIDLLASGVIMAVLDDNGPMFTADDIELVKSTMSIGTLRFISAEVGKLTGGDEDQKKDAVLSSATPSSDSPSNSAAS